MMIGVGFKLGIVPFHMWTPDIYEGAPLPVAAYIATVSEEQHAGVAHAFLGDIDGYEYTILWWVFAVIASDGQYVRWQLAGPLAAECKTPAGLFFHCTHGLYPHRFPRRAAGRAGGRDLYLVAYVITSIGRIWGIGHPL